MIGVLDGYLIGAGTDEGVVAATPFFYGHLGPMALLDGCLIGSSYDRSQEEPE